MGGTSTRTMWGGGGSLGSAALRATVLVTPLLLGALAVPSGGLFRGAKFRDLHLYRRYGDALLAGHVPYRDFFVEYPPGAIPLFAGPSLAPEVRDHEPVGALFAGPDGLDVIRALVRAAPGSLSPGGVLIFEFGWEQSDAVTRLIQSTRELRLVGIRRDLQGIPRVAIAQSATASVR